VNNLFGIFVLILRLLVVDLEVSQLIAVLGRCNNTEPISQIVLLEVLLCQVLQVPLGEGNIRGEGNLGLLSLHGELFAKVVGLASNLDTLMEVLLEVGTVHDAILDRVGTINEELDLVLLAKLLHSLTLTLELLLAGLLCCFLSWCHFNWGPLLRELDLL